MIFKNFRIHVVIRVILFMLISIALVYCIYNELYLRSIDVALALIIAVAEFIRYVDKTNRDFTSFLWALSQNDFTTTYAEKGKGGSFNKLYRAFNQITNKFRSISEEKEAQFIFLSLLVEHVRVGILSIDDEGQIHLINHSMKNFLNNHTVKNLVDIASSGDELAEVFSHIRVGENRLLKKTLNGKIVPLTIHATELRLQDKYYKLISVQNIKNELEAHELEAWQKLIRVLTHEIMNSVSPIISLSSTLHNVVNKQPTSGIDPEDQEKLQKGLEAIKIRSHGLQHFADAYRSITRIPQPQFKKVEVKKIFDRLSTLFKDEVSTKGITLNVEVESEASTILADPELLEQVLINLLRNAFDAVSEKDAPLVTIKSKGTASGFTSIFIIDNGAGIPAGEIDKIFIPFYTTKKSGSGIGLALSKQIVQLHSGQISIESKIGSGTTVEVRL
ncbi:MAG: ATP-binding protein [Cyclobacteriaceae bacterium]